MSLSELLKQAKTIEELIEPICMRCSGCGHVPKKEAVDRILKTSVVSVEALKDFLLRKEPPLRKRVEVWLGACWATRKGPKGCYITTLHEEWKCKDCQRIFGEAFSEKVSWGLEEKDALNTCPKCGLFNYACICNKPKQVGLEEKK